VDGNIYVVGGLSGGVPTDAVQVYNPAGNSWTLSTPLPEPLSGSVMGTDSLGRLIVMGGSDTNGYDVGDVWRSQQLGAPDSPPVFTQFPTTNGIYQSPYSSSIAATGNPQPVFLLASGPAGMTVDYFSGQITWTPQGLNQVGAIPVTIAATNYAGSTNWSFTITVPNPKPTTLTNLYLASATEYAVTLAWAPEDPVAGSVTYSVFIPHPYHSPRGSGGGVNQDRWARLNSLDRPVHMGVVILHAGERMLVATLPESFESVADHLGVFLGEHSALGGSVGDLGLERDAGGHHRQRLKRGIRLNVRKGWVFIIPLRGDYGFGDRNGDLVGSRVVAGVHWRVSYVMGGPPLDARKGSAHSRAALGRTCSNAPNCCDLLPFACGEGRCRGLSSERRAALVGRG